MKKMIWIFVLLGFYSFSAVAAEIITDIEGCYPTASSDFNGVCKRFRLKNAIPGSEIIYHVPYGHADNLVLCQVDGNGRVTRMHRFPDTIGFSYLFILHCER